MPESRTTTTTRKRVLTNSERANARTRTRRVGQRDARGVLAGAVRARARAALLEAVLELEVRGDLVPCVVVVVVVVAAEKVPRN